MKLSTKLEITIYKAISVSHLNLVFENFLPLIWLPNFLEVLKSPESLNIN